VWEDTQKFKKLKQVLKTPKREKSSDRKLKMKDKRASRTSLIGRVRSLNNQIRLLKEAKEEQDSSVEAEAGRTQNHYRHDMVNISYFGVMSSLETWRNEYQKRIDDRDYRGGNE
jgi:hypothetical protein